MAFGIGSINPMSAILNVATGGIAGLAARNLVSSFGQNLIQQLGQAIGLPQPLIDAAQGQFAMATGDVYGGVTNFREAAEGFAEARGYSPTDSAQYGQDMQDLLAQGAADLAGGPEVRAARSGGRGGSWLMAMAEALGQKADQLAGEMQDMADQMAGSKSDPSASVKFGAKSQEFGLFMNSTNNAIKTAGESLTTAARKGG